jgi:hypothetical protein
MTFPSRSFSASAALVLSLILSACGGGGGSTASGSTAVAPAAASISPENFQAAAATATSPVGDLIDLNITTSLIVVGVEVNAPPLSLASVSIAIYKRFRGTGSRLATGVVVTEQCSGGGSVSIDESTASSATFTVGDRATFTFTDCKEPNLSTLNGVVNFRIAALSGDFNSTTYNFGMAATFDNFSFSGAAKRQTIKGDLAVVVSQNGTSTVNTSMSGSSLAITNGVPGASANTYLLTPYTLYSTEANGSTSLSAKYTLSGSSTKLGGDYTYNVETLQPLIMSSSTGDPSNGSFIVRGAPATVTVTALDATSVRIDYSEKGDGVVSATKTMTWTAFDQLLN